MVKGYTVHRKMTKIRVSMITEYYNIVSQIKYMSTKLNMFIKK